MVRFYLLLIWNFSFFKSFFQLPPALKVFFVQILILQGCSHYLKLKVGLKHESQRPNTHLLRFQVSSGSLREDFTLRTMPRHARVERSLAWSKSFLFGIVLTTNVAHEFTHGIPMVPRRSKGILLNKPPLRENHKITNSLPMVIWLCSQHSENARVRVVRRYRTNRLEEIQIVPVRVIISMPSNHIKWRPLDFIFKELSPKFIHNSPILIHILILSHWNLKVLGVSQTVGTYWSQVWQSEVTLIQFT